MSVASLALGIVAALLCWMPVDGLLAVPSGGLGVVLAIGGAVVSRTDRRSGLTVSAIGGGLGLIAIIAAIVLAWSTEVSTQKERLAAVQAAAVPPVAIQQPLPEPAPAPDPIVPDPAEPVPGLRLPRAPRLRPAVVQAPPTPMGQPAIQGEIEIRVVKVERGKVRLRVRDPRLKAKRQPDSNEPFLSIFLEVKNTSKGRKIDYATLAGPSVRLSDEFGNRYKATNFGVQVAPVGRAEATTILPGKSVGDQLVFELPVDAAERLLLEIPAERAAIGKVAFRFEILAGAIVARQGR